MSKVSDYMDDADAYVNKLKDLNNHLKRLLDDPHPGLITWNIMVADYIKEMYELT
jgi:hypothetical protein